MSDGYRCPSCESDNLTFTSAGPVGGWLADCEECGFWFRVPSVYERPWVAKAFLIGLIFAPAFLETRW